MIDVLASQAGEQDGSDGLSDAALLEDALEAALDAHATGDLAAPFGLDEVALTRARQEARRRDAAKPLAHEQDVTTRPAHQPNRFHPELAVRFRQEPSTAGPGLPLTTKPATTGNPMAKPAMDNATINASAEVQTRAEALHAAHLDAIEQCARRSTSNNLRMVATVGRELAQAYRELANEFCDSAALFHALCRARDHLTAHVQQYDAWADDVEHRAAMRGDAS